MSEPLPWEDGPIDELAKGADDHINNGDLLTEVDPEELFGSHAKQPWEYARTELGNAELFRSRFRESLRWAPDQNKWWVWTGKNWREDSKNEASASANRIARLRRDASGGAGDEKDVKAEMGWAVASESLSKRDACLGQAKSFAEMCLDLTELDKNPWLLNCTNGVLDLKTMELKPHQSRLYLSKITKVDYLPKAQCPLWEAYLDKVMAGKSELIDFIQRALGYSLTGSTRETAVFVPWGDGSNGKSVLLDTATSILGDYATTAASDALIAKNRSGGPTPEIAMLRGARLVSASETASGARLDEAMIKQMTGGDLVTARFLNANHITFRPLAKIWLATNHKPEVRGMDHGIWRRIKLIPFQVKISDEERDLDFAEKLKTEWPGILAWMVRGYLSWIEGGLREPEEVRMATRVYQAEMDPVQAFLDARCLRLDVPNLNWAISCMRLYENYKSWAEACGERPLSLTRFGSALRNKGIVKEKTRDGLVYKGVSLVTDSRTDDVIGNML
ncbi:MAG: hypothetical protein E6R03_06165 [Hyphomicrobiaceae bacterium]|nr:MAG: hypothetical protein E6R03_06165 [Hyphomicrobiaceae bacterium]